MALMWAVTAIAVGGAMAGPAGEVAASRHPRQFCCMAFNVPCMACAAQMTPEQYCAQTPQPQVCANYVPPPPTPPPTPADCRTLNNCLPGQRCAVVTCLVAPCSYSCQAGGTTCNHVTCPNFGQTCRATNGQAACFTAAPTRAPTRQPTRAPVVGTAAPTQSMAPTPPPTVQPTATQTASPTFVPTYAPTAAPSSLSPTTAGPTASAPSSAGASSSSGGSSGGGDMVLIVVIVVIVVVGGLGLVALHSVMNRGSTKSSSREMDNPAYTMSGNTAYESDAPHDDGYLDVNNGSSGVN